MSLPVCTNAQINFLFKGILSESSCRGNKSVLELPKIVERKCIPINPNRGSSGACGTFSTVNEVVMAEDIWPVMLWSRRLEEDDGDWEEEWGEEW